MDRSGIFVTTKLRISDCALGQHGEEE